MRRDEKILCPDYIAFIKARCCVTCGKTPVDPHHLIAQGWRQSKRNDLTCVPLCRGCHGEIEQVGVEKFEWRHRVSIWGEAAWLLIEFFSNPLRGEAVITFGSKGRINLSR